MMMQPILTSEARPCVQRAERRARADVLGAVMPDVVERFPDQVEDTVQIIARLRLDNGECCLKPAEQA
jgi:hypothetical protein